MVAAGGGGDAITAAALGPALGLTHERPVVMTYAWDRLIIDPLPGPRSASDFTGLRQLGPDVLEILPSTKPIPPAGSTLPRLAAELACQLLLLDPTEGAVGMARQIQAAADHFNADSIALVDVGGDSITDGNDEGLRSPLADLLAVAACSIVDRPAQLIVPAPGIDGELPEPTVIERIQQLGGKCVAQLKGSSFAAVRSIFAWHPSEASGLLALATEGARGDVEVRDAGCIISLTDRTLSAYSVNAEAVANWGPSAKLRQTESLQKAEKVIRDITGRSEILYERQKAQSRDRQDSLVPTSCELSMIDKHMASAAARGADFISIRRLAELAGVRSCDHLVVFRQLLRDQRGWRYRPPVVAVGDGGP